MTRLHPDWQSHGALLVSTHHHPASELHMQTCCQCAQHVCRRVSHPPARLCGSESAACRAHNTAAPCCLLRRTGGACTCSSLNLACWLTAAAPWVESAIVCGRAVPRQRELCDECCLQHPHQLSCKGLGALLPGAGPTGPMPLLPASRMTCPTAAAQASLWGEFVEEDRGDCAPPEAAARRL